MLFKFLGISFIIFLSGCTAQMITKENDPDQQLLKRYKTALCIPINYLHVSYVDNTKSIPDTLFNDSFFIEAANGLFAYEVSQNFKIVPFSPADSDSISSIKNSGYSRLNSDTSSFSHMTEFVKSIAKKHKTDLVVVPYSCIIKHITVRPTGWRNDKFSGPGYEKPISYTAKTEFHVQIWDKTGALLYERIGKSDTGRPVFYSFLKKEKNPDKDIVKYAKRFYAPPLVKSLYNSIKIALQVRI